MNDYFETLKNHIEQHLLKLGDADPVLTLLCEAYNAVNAMLHRLISFRNQPISEERYHRQYITPSSVMHRRAFVSTFSFLRGRRTGPCILRNAC